MDIDKDIFIPWRYPFNHAKPIESAIVYSKESFDFIMADERIKELLNTNSFFISHYDKHKSHTDFEIPLTTAYARVKDIHKSGITISILTNTCGERFFNMYNARYSKQIICASGHFLVKLNGSNYSRSNPKLIRIELFSGLDKKHLYPI